jgi:beta-lactamase regulating signal transducer with metallopeptidase domain
VEWLINWLWQGLALTAIAAAALSCLRRLNAATRHRVWWVTLWLVLLLPLLSASAVSAPPSSEATPALAQSRDIPASAASGPVLVLDGAPDWTMNAVVILWSAWCGWSLLRATWSLLAIRRFRRRAEPLPAERERALRLWPAQRDSGRAATLRVSRDVATAGVFGFHPPIIALSPAALAALSNADLDRVVAHEHAHVQRRDDVGRVLLVAIQAVFGLHPAVWWIGRAIDFEREIACDDWVLALTGDGPRYARCLTTLAGVSPAPRWSLAPGVSLATRRLAMRVTRLLDPGQHGGTRISPAAVVVWGPALLSMAVSLAAVKLVVVQEAEALAASATSAIELEVTSMAAPLPLLPLPAPAPMAAPAGAGVIRSVGMPPRADAAARRLVHHVRTITAPPQISSFPESAPAATAPSAALTNLRTAASVAPLGTIASGVAGVPRPSPSVRAPVDARKAGGPTPWSLAADAGVAIGTGSRIAAVKTAVFFSRFGKSVASSFQPTQVNLKR